MPVNICSIKLSTTYRTWNCHQKWCTGKTLVIYFFTSVLDRWKRNVLFSSTCYACPLLTISLITVRPLPLILGKCEFHLFQVFQVSGFQGCLFQLFQVHVPGIVYRNDRHCHKLSPAPFPSARFPRVPAPVPAVASSSPINHSLPPPDGPVLHRSGVSGPAR